MGTLQVYKKAIRDGKPTLCLQEFLIPFPVRQAVALEGKVLMVSSTHGELFLVEFKTNSEGANILSEDSIRIKVTRMEIPTSVLHFCIMDTQDHKTTFQALLGHGMKVQAKIDLKYDYSYWPLILLFLNKQIASEQSSELPLESHRLKVSIEETLKKLSQYEEMQKQLETQHETLNSQLVAINQIIYALQSAKGPDNTTLSDMIYCELQPVVVDDTMTYITSATAMIKIHIASQWSIHWDEWQVHVDVVEQRGLAQETLSLDAGKEDTSKGTTFNFSLSGLDRDCNWKKLFALDLKKTRLPVDVMVSVSATIPSSTTQQEEDQFVFPIFHAMLDDLHFIKPCSASMQADINLLHFARPLRMAQESVFKRKRLATHNRRPVPCSGSDGNGKNKQGAWMDLSDTAIQFDLANKKVLWTEAYRSILSSLLQEGRTSEEMKSILQSAEKAVFILAAYPQFPVVVTIARDDAISTRVHLKITSQNTYVLLKVQSAILGRLESRMVSDTAKAENSSQFIEGEFGKLQSNLVSAMMIAEKKMEKDQDIRTDISAALGLAEKLHSSRSIGWIMSDIEEDVVDDPMVL
ncbi:hypothetical protein EC973_000032 [Apophysomyces ossiformis]|uniref:Uncharacterized protein n=1 Tax=Apophysomyces ossiformis TaxID=679940 RepID=A0A8H7EUB0_9FUNG|nr:hypothetical protein EC973_000032 [Apophysomyces ossiformis]